LGGLFALAAVVVALAPVVARRPASIPGALATGAMAGLVVLLVHGTVDFNLRIPSNAVVAALLASFVVSAAPLRPVARKAGLAAALAFGAAALLALPRPGASIDPAEEWERARSEARRSAASTTPTARVLHLERTEQAAQAAIRQRPAHAEAWLLLAGARAQRGDPSAPELARHAAWLDPERPELQQAARALSR
jgi:cytochrome c-type biogenesis protein CcmH/NrfG